MPRRLRIVGWNIRAGGGRRIEAIYRQLIAWRADIIGLSEFRGTGPSSWLAQQLANRGFGHQIASVAGKSPARNALLLASRWPLLPVQARPMPRIRERWILATTESTPSITLGLMHVPNHTSPKQKYPYLSSLSNMAAGWRLGPALIFGDSNCGKRDLDEEKPQGPRFQREHDWMVGMERRGWADIFRYLHGERREYTWYSHRNNGFRLDHAFASPGLVPAIDALRHAWGQDPAAPRRRDALSDHAALIVDFRLERLPG